jgi:hypothetical protein
MSCNAVLVQNGFQASQNLSVLFHPVPTSTAPSVFELGMLGLWYGRVAQYDGFDVPSKGIFSDSDLFKFRGGASGWGTLERVGIPQEANLDPDHSLGLNSSRGLGHLNEHDHRIKV